MLHPAWRWRRRKIIFAQPRRKHFTAARKQMQTFARNALSTTFKTVQKYYIFNVTWKFPLMSKKWKWSRKNQKFQKNWFVQFQCQNCCLLFSLFHHDMPERATWKWVKNFPVTHLETLLVFLPLYVPHHKKMERRVRRKTALSITSSVNEDFNSISKNNNNEGLSGDGSGEFVARLFNLLIKHLPNGYKYNCAFDNVNKWIFSHVAICYHLN